LGGASRGQCAVRVSEFDWVEILALNVFDDGDFESVFGFDIGDDRGDRFKTRDLGRAPSSLTHDQLKASACATHDDRLKHAVKLN
jgi:hypothetical protein